ncbi:MAG: hypothetical protein IJY84_03855 [Clostridia bacterium]|nr:hypothetical protein [Clostridia bacterium]
MHCINILRAGVDIAVSRKRELSARFLAECGRKLQAIFNPKIRPMPKTKKDIPCLVCLFWWWAGVDSDHRSQ